MILSKNKLIISLLMAIITPSLSLCKSSKCKNSNSLIGQKAPDFAFMDKENNPTTLYAFTGTKRALIFYPQDESYVCTQQLCSIRDNKAILEENKIMAIGISPDSQKSHESFKENKQLPFLLVSDPKKEIAKLYHATGGWFGYNKRITVLIDENNKVIGVIDNVKTSHHTKQILDGFHENK